MSASERKAEGARDAEIREALRPHAADGRIDCRDALAIAARLGVPPSQVGRICNVDKIKIANCQLGCFGMRGKSK
jgi:hypothetical protein